MTEKERSRCIGIDLGTTNSLVAYVGASGFPEIIPARDQTSFTPSVVGRRSGPVRGGSRFLVGRLALNNARRDPCNTIRSIKRFMGLSFGDPRVSVARERVSYEIQEDPTQPGRLLVRIGDDLMAPEEISAEILRQIKEDAEARLGGPGSLPYAVITCPAYFSEPQRVATRKAGMLADLRVKALLDEPTAAALSEIHGRDVDRARLLVFDFGGGTLDISLVQVSQQDGVKRYHVVSYAGDNFLGGDDIDAAIAGIIRNHILDRGGVIDPGDHRLAFELLDKAEQVKKTLSGGADPSAVIIPGACRMKDGSLVDVDLEITQEQFAGVLEPFKARVGKLLEEYLRREGLDPTQISEVLMVGGSSAIPAIQELLRVIFEPDGQQRVKLARRPMDAVALGAAIYGEMIGGILCPKCGEENPVDATKCSSCGEEELQMAPFAQRGGSQEGVVSAQLPWSLGVRYRAGSDDDAYQIILPRGISYPTPTPRVETFRIPSTGGFAIEIYEGDDNRASRNRLISIFQVDQIPPDVKEKDAVEVGFAFTRDRTLYISLRYPTSKMGFQPRWMIRPPSDAEAGDPLRELTSLLPMVRRFLGDYRDFLGEGIRKKLEADINSAGMAVMQGDREEAQRLQRALVDTMMEGGGAASTLFLAEKSVAVDDPQFGPAIREGANNLRRQLKANDADVESARRALDHLVVRALEKKVSTPRVRPSQVIRLER
ncbi:MAG: Hsp70 family protein [Planctomycetes bacterium]|nr:Hsp70 family protein [Planctomycetota bacterium]